MFEEVPIDKITIGPRFRQDLGDIPALAASIEAIGLLHPIIVTTEYELVAGGRRVAAHEHLGRTAIEARVIDLDDPMAAEVDENAQRKPYAVSEWVAIGKAREARDTKNASQRMSEGGKKAGRGRKIGGVNLTPPMEQGKARDITATAAGMSWLTYQHAKAVVEAARANPELQDLVEEMDRTGKVASVYKQLLLELHSADLDTIKPLRILRFPKLLERLDDVMQDVLVPALPTLNVAQCAQLCTMFNLYLAMLAEQKETAHDAGAA